MGVRLTRRGSKWDSNHWSELRAAYVPDAGGQYQGLPRADPGGRVTPVLTSAALQRRVRQTIGSSAVEMASVSQLLTRKLWLKVNNPTHSASRLTDLMLGEVETSEPGPSRRFVAMQQYVGHRRHTDSGKPFAWRVYRFTA